MAVACSGALTRTGGVADLAESALVLLDASQSPPPELRRMSASEIAGGPLQNDVVFANDDLVLLKTQTAFAGPDSNRWLSLRLDDGQSRTLLEAGYDSEGKGQGIVYGGMSCAPGCSDICLLADADRSVLQRVRVTGAEVELLAPIRVENEIGLPPRDLALR
jgi:hypothetical protein